MPARKVTEKSASSQDPGSKNAGCTDKKTMVLLMECDAQKCRALCKALEDAGFGIFVCNDLSSCIHTIRVGYEIGFALIAPTIEGRNGYMLTVRKFCAEQKIPLEEIDDYTVGKIKRHGIHFQQQIAPPQIITQ